MVHAKMHLLDSIEAVVYGPANARVITKWDIARPPLGGPAATLDEVVLEYLICDDAQKLKIAPSESDVDRILDTVRKQNNLTLDQLSELVKENGYTMEEIRERFKRMQVVNQMLDYRVRSNVIIPRREIVNYYEANPEIEEARLVIRRACIPFVQSKPANQESLEAAQVSQAAQLTELTKKAVDNKAIKEQITWGEPFTVLEGDLACDKKFLLNLKVGCMHGPTKVAQGFELFEMIERRDKRTRTLDERYSEITEKLKEPTFKRLFDEYKTKLTSEASVLKLGS